MRSLKQTSRRFISFRHHYIMNMPINSINREAWNSSLALRKASDYSELIDGTYSIKTQRKLIERNAGKCETFILMLEDGQRPIVICSVMYKNGNELEYRIRNIDAFIYNVKIDSAYRGKGYAAEMIKRVGSELKNKNINELYLAVSTDNVSAIKAYKRAGFEIVSEKWFVRIARKNIPYHSI